MDQKKGPWADIFNFYSDATGELITYLLSNEKFMENMQKFMVASVEFREVMRKAVQAMMIQLKLPTGEELSRVEQAMHELEDRIFSLEEKLESMDGKLDEIVKIEKKASSATKIKTKAKTKVKAETKIKAESGK